MDKVEDVQIVYPESDGKPMSDNTLQFYWIVLIESALEAMFADRPDVFVAGDLLWYPVEGDPKMRAAPDVMVALGRPKGHRGSYKQWEEGGIAPQVAFEILSPGNTKAEMQDKHAFYARHGVQEYYVYDPFREVLEGYLREGSALVPVPEMDGWRSPLLGIRFEWGGAGLRLFKPDGESFKSYVEIVADRDSAVKDSILFRAKAERARRELEAERRRAEAQQRELEAMKAKLRSLGIDPDDLG